MDSSENMPAPFHDDGAVRLLHGDCRDVLPTLDADSFDSVVCDPPYDLTGSGKGGFMGKAWDATGVAFDPETWRAVLRVLKPGGYMLAFGGTQDIPPDGGGDRGRRVRDPGFGRRII
jgi:DNA modification methylase